MPQLVPPRFCLHALRGAVSEAVKGSLRITPDFQIGWPAWSRKGAPQGQPFVCVEIALGVALDQPPLLICFEAPLVLALVDRTLGGKGFAGPSHSGAQLSAAEEGVFCFLLAKLMRDFANARVVGVFRGPFPEPAQHVVVPVRVTLATVESAFYVLWPAAEHALSASAQTLVVELSISDHLEPDSLASLDRGDLLTFDHAPLHNVNGELSGPLTASVEGIDERLEVRIQSIQLSRDKRGRSAPKATNAHVTIWQGALTVADAARLYHGERIDLGALPSHFILRHNQGRCATGNLVFYRSKLALEVTDLSAPSDSKPRNQ